MESFLVPIYIKTNPLSDERFCMALLAVCPNRIFYKYSENKISKISSFLDKGNKSLIINALSNIGKEVKEALRSNENLPFEKNKWFSLNYFDYLSEYSRGIFSFGAARAVSPTLDDKLFNHLFISYVGEQHLSSDKNTFKKEVNNFLKHKAFNKIDKNYTLTPSMLDNVILANHKVDFLGVNGAILGGNSLDIHVEKPELERKVFIYNHISLGLMNFAKKLNINGGSNYAVYCKEPENNEASKNLKEIKKLKLPNLTIKMLPDLADTAKLIDSKPYMKVSDLGNI